jgi:hypothetical protein
VRHWLLDNLAACVDARIDGVKRELDYPGADRAHLLWEIEQHTLDLASVRALYVASHVITDEQFVDAYARAGGEAAATVADVLKQPDLWVGVV